jgi:hypothetical protein
MNASGFDLYFPDFYHSDFLFVSITSISSGVGLTVFSDSFDSQMDLRLSKDRRHSDGWGENPAGCVGCRITTPLNIFQRIWTTLDETLKVAMLKRFSSLLTFRINKLERLSLAILFSPP